MAAVASDAAASGRGGPPVLAVADIGISPMGFVCRFVFDRPLVWSDELASLPLLWLAMVGAAVALYRGSRMRLSTATAMTPIARQRRPEAASACARSRCR